MSDLRERIKEARELCDLPGSYGTLAVVRRKLDEILSVIPEAKARIECQVCASWHNDESGCPLCRGDTKPLTPVTDEVAA